MINMSSNRKAFKQLFLMIILTMLTQLITLLKLSVTASQFGATTQMDAFNFINSISTFLFSFIGTGITTVLIPAIINKINRKSINNFISILYSVALLVIIIIVIIRRPIIQAFSSNSLEFVEIASSLMLITLISQFFNTVIGVTNAVFQCNGKYNIPKILTLITTTLLTIMVVLNSNLNIYEYAFYILITGFINMIMQVYITEKDGFKYRPIINFNDDNLKDMMRVFIPTVFSSGLYQISLLTDSMISSKLGEGQISILSYSNSIMSMINMLLIGNLMTYIYPKITKFINSEDGKKYLFDYFMFFNAIMCLMVAGFFVVGKEGITLLYQRGRFNSSVTDVVYMCTLIYIIGLPINVMRDLVYRYFYAKGDTKITFINSITASIVNIVISIILSNFIGIYGIVLGTVITSVFSLTSILIRFNRRYVLDIDKIKIIIENCKIFIICFLSIAITLTLKHYLIINNELVSILVYGICVTSIYVILLILLKSNLKNVKL